MVKHIQVLVSQWCPTYPQAEHLWAESAGKPARSEVSWMSAGADIVAELMIWMIPATGIDSRLAFIGVPALYAVLEAAPNG